MGVVGVIAAMVAVLVALAATVAVYPAMFRAFRDQSRRIPPERRGRARVGAGIALAACVVVGALLVVQPWGTKTVVWLILVGGGGITLVSLAGVSVQAVIDIRRARKRRSPKP